MRSPLPNTTTFLIVVISEGSWVTAEPMVYHSSASQRQRLQEKPAAPSDRDAGSTGMRIFLCSSIADHPQNIRLHSLVHTETFPLQSSIRWRRLWWHRITLRTPTRSRKCTVQERPDLVPRTQMENRYGTRTDWTPTRHERCPKSLYPPTFTRHASKLSSITATTRHFDGLFKLLLGHWDWKVKNCFISFADHIVLLQIWFHI